MRPGEDELIARVFAPLAGPGGLGLTDDAARLTPPHGHDLVLTADALVAGVHFRPDDPPDAIGWKALAVNLSDLAAKGADPSGFLLSLALPDAWTPDWLDGFARGLGRLAAECACPLLGGDTVRAAGCLTLSITAIGAVPSGRMVLRRGARPGDLVCVTGSIGDAVLGLALGAAEPPDWAGRLCEGDRAHLVDRYLRPRPRSSLAGLLRENATAAMDVSDGLVGDFAKLTRVSDVAGELDLDRVPLSGPAKASLELAPERRDALLTGGDDYEILFTLPPDKLDEISHAAAASGIPVTAIGRVMPGPTRATFLDRGEPRTFATGSYQHF